MYGKGQSSDLVKSSHPIIIDTNVSSKRFRYLFITKHRYFYKNPYILIYLHHIIKIREEYLFHATD